MRTVCFDKELAVLNENDNGNYQIIVKAFFLIVGRMTIVRFPIYMSVGEPN